MGEALPQAIHQFLRVRAGGVRSAAPPPGLRHPAPPRHWHHHPPDDSAIRPPAVIIEYIPDAVSLCDVPVELVTPELCAALLRIVDSFGSYGVVHTDVNWNNVLFTPSKRPTRVVVMDFGCGGVRTDDQDEEDWKQSAVWANDGPRLRWALERRGIGVPAV